MIFYTIFISIWGYSERFTDCIIIPKWLFSIFGTLLTIIWYTANRLLGGNIQISVSFIKYNFIAVVCLQAIYGILQKTGVSIYTPTYYEVGSFDNPAGFASCLCMGLPFTSLLLFNRRRFIHITGCVLIGIIAIAVILSSSRAGIISIVAVALIMLCRKLTFANNSYKYLLLIGFALFFAYCYWTKKDSADGRLLIWHCSMDLVEDSPFWGHGIGGFEAHYMDIQADYFRKAGVNNRFAMLAGNVKNPFNEYLHILLTCGFAGLLFLASFIVWMCHRYKKYPCREKRIAAYVLSSVGIFSLFSYPFNYPFTWVVTVFCIYLILKGKNIKYSHSQTQYVLTVLAFVGALFCMAKLILYISSEIKWNKASELVLVGDVDNALPIYKDLRGTFNSNPYFLYNYAVVLKECGKYCESQQNAKWCRKYWSDYDLELLMGENAKQMKKYDKAETYYLQASLMCPSRFFPLYKLFQLYKECEKRDKIDEVAKQILSKRIKYKTPAVMMIRREAKDYLDDRLSPSHSIP